jgi:3D (Asp-Asp-Asp) domain-containing protein
VYPVPPPLTPSIPVIEELPPVLRTHTIWVRVTACSPEDPKDKSYYKKYGYEGSTYGIAARIQDFPKGTRMRIEGYRGGEWQEVNAKGGGVIRKAAKKGFYQIDVKFKTHYSAKQWGSRWMEVEVAFEDDWNEYIEQQRTSHAVL